MENGVRILHREENVAPVRSAESKQRPQAEALTSQRICFIPTILHSCISVTCAAISGFLWTFFFAVRIQHSLICQTVLSYSSANPSQVPYECFKGSKPHCQLLNSARCLQSEAVSKGCVEFVEAAEQRKRDRSCLHCTSAAVSPMDTTGRVGAYGGRQCITASRVTAQNSTNLLLPVARIPLSLPKTLP